MKEMASCMSVMPGPELDVAARVPEQAAPASALETASSLSICIIFPPYLGRMTAMRFMMSVAGVIGYAKWYFTPQRANLSAKFSVFFKNIAS